MSYARSSLVPVQGADEIVVVEGELDKLAVEEALMQVAASTADGSAPPAAAPDPAVFMQTPDGTRRAVISVPAGAPSRAATTSQSQERKFKFVSGEHRLQQQRMGCAETCAWQ